MQVKKVTLEGKKINSLNDLYDQISAQLTLPEHFGRNLDALWDVLSADVEGPLEITWKDAADSKKLMGKDFDRAEKLLKDLKKERDDFRLKIDR